MVTTIKINNILLDNKKIESFHQFRRLLLENVGLRYSVEKKVLHIETSNNSMTNIEMIETKFPARKKIIFNKNQRNQCGKIDRFVYYSHGVIECLRYNPYNIIGQSFITNNDFSCDERFPWVEKKVYDNAFYRGNKIDDFSSIFEDLQKFKNMPKLILYEEDGSLKIDFNYIDPHVYAPIFAQHENCDKITVEKKVVTEYYSVRGEFHVKYFARGDLFHFNYAERYIIFRGNKKIDILYIERKTKKFVDENKLELIDGEELEIVKKIIG